MPSGTLYNLEHSAFVRTPPAFAADILHNLLACSESGMRTILDPTAGEGDLLFPCQGIVGARLFGVEISQERALVARTRLPHATILAHAIEATRIPKASMSLVLCNPPYYFEREDATKKSQRAEYRVIADAGEALLPGGIMVAIIPARSAWKGAMIHHWARHYTHIRCWKFPDSDEITGDAEIDFDRFTQMVVIGVRRDTPLETPDPVLKQQLAGWQWKKPKGAESPWLQGFPPPMLPTAPIEQPYTVPVCTGVYPELKMLHAGEAELLHAMQDTAIAAMPAWEKATHYQPQATASTTMMPPIGEAHLAAEVATGLLDSTAIQGPDGDWYCLATFVSTIYVEMEVDPDLMERERKKHVVSLEILEQQDVIVIGVLHLETGEVCYYDGEAAYAFLLPWLPLLAEQVLARRQPRYQLHPAEWELDVVSRIGLDKHLHGAEHPGLVAPQQHRVYAMAWSLDAIGRAAIQGEPGVGKSRICVAIAARQAFLWHHADELRKQGVAIPKWVKRLRQAWSHNPRTRKLLLASKNQHFALPVLISTPKRVTSTWEREITTAYPDVEVMVISTYQDIPKWLERCARTSAPVVFGIVSHSSSRAFGRIWKPAVIEKMTQVEVIDLTPPKELLPLLQPVKNGSQITAYLLPDGSTLMRQQERLTFRCPMCGATVIDRPRSAIIREEDTVDVVTSRTYFTTKPRWCIACGGALWTEARTGVITDKYPQISYADWSTAVTSVPVGERAKTQSGPRNKTPRIVNATGARGAVAPDSYSPYEYAQQFYKGCIALAVIDESHNARGKATDIGHSIHLAQLASQMHLYASGTQFGGILDSFYHYWLRYNPQFWRNLGFGWKDSEKAIMAYGLVQRWIRERESDARKGSGRSDTTESTVPAPGLSINLIPHLLSDLSFLAVLDVGSYMPPRTEIPVIVSMRDSSITEPLREATDRNTAALAEVRTAQVAVDIALAAGDDPALLAAKHALALAQQIQHETQAHLEVVQEWHDARDLSGEYDRIATTLSDLAKERNQAATLAQGTLPRLFATMLMGEPFVLDQLIRGEWGDVLGTTRLLQTKRLCWDHVYPLERKLIEIVEQELGEERRTMIYVEQSQKRDMAARLEWVLRDSHPWTLPHTIDAEEREEAIRQAVAQGHKVIIASYRLVSEGLICKTAWTILYGPRCQ